MSLTRRRALGLGGLALGGGSFFWYVQRDGDAGFGPASRPAASDGQLADFVRSSTEFGLSLHQHLADDDPEANQLFSPVSLSTAFAMAWAGAREETATQMADVLEFSLGRDDLHPAAGALQYDLDARADDAASPGVIDRLRGGREFELTVANALWGLEDYPYREDFLETLEANYGAGLRTVDFVGDPDAARATINDWCAEATNDRIDELLPSQVITQDTRFVLTNAVTLLADWDEPFDPDDTTDEPFTAIDGETTDVRLMSQTDDFPYAMVDGHQVVELPYVGEAISMVVVLPAEGEFEAFESDLEADYLHELLEELSETEIQLSLPRFEFDTEIELADRLSALGMPDAFDRDAANFGGIADDQEPGNLFLFDVHHQTYVAVDEAGTEAIAATGISGGLASGPGQMTVDRPFLFCIRDRETDAILFLGRVVDAAAAQ